MENKPSRSSPLREAGGTLHEIALVEKYVEKTTINSWFFFAFNLQNRKPNFAQKSLYKLYLKLNNRKSLWKNLTEKVCKKQQMEITLWLLCVFTLSKNVVATLCLRSWFLWWNHVSRESSFFASENACSFSILKLNSLSFSKISAETHKNYQNNKNCYFV